MKYDVPIAPLPDDLEISDVLTRDEMPKIIMKTDLLKPLKREERGASFHEKSVL